MGRMLVGVAGLLLSGLSIAAEELPWCVKLDVFTKNCAFATYKECVAVASDATSPATGTGQCIPNPEYHAPPTTAAHAKPAAAKSSAQIPQR